MQIAPQYAVDGLAVIGALVVAVVALGVLYYVTLATPILLERFIDWLAARVFFAFGGKAYRDGEGQLPRAPWDRLWVELRWLSGVCRWLQGKVGLYDWVKNPGKRPDMEAFREAREKSGSVERSTLAKLYKNDAE